MNEYVIYFLKVNASLALFYILFRAVFYKDTFWIGRRIYLISAILISLFYPFVSLSNWFAGKEQAPIFITEWYLPEFIVVQEATPVSISWQQILFAIYILISMFLLVRFFVQLFSILRWNRKSQNAFVLDIPVKVLSENIAPFSFFKSIYINPDTCSDEELKEVLAHENTHARQWHSLDVVLGELLTIICWINPFAWLLKGEIRQNLEFLADNQVVQSGFDKKNYQYFLMNLALYSPDIQLTNKFNVLPLKKRITMMNQAKTKKAGLVKYLLILPLAFTLVLANNAQSQNSTPNEGDVFQYVEKMPSFPGGTDALMKFLAENLQYPKEAEEDGVQGNVIVRFVIRKTGKIDNVEIKKSVHPLLDKEAVRVVESLPNFIPGEENGEKVDVYFTLPINFSLSADEKPHEAIKLDGKLPLWIVDGVRMGRKEPDPSYVSSINPENIESIDILKGETAIKHYGEEAKDGVLVITTKKKN